MEAHTTLLLLSITFLELSNRVNAKFCAFDLNGERRYYTCPRNEYCCNFGCCVSPAFQFYQLWYYWLLVIFMFLLCSGGGWWYRYWLQSRYRTCPGSILPVTNTTSRQARAAPTRGAGTQPRRPSRSRAARVSYNPARDTVVLHRVWKGTRNCPPPSYTSAQAELSGEASLTHPPTTPATTSMFPPSYMAQSSSGVRGQDCPYYQLYGPPPSYDSVMSELEHSMPVVTPTGQSSSVDRYPNIPETSIPITPVVNAEVSDVSSYIPPQSEAERTAPDQLNENSIPQEGSRDVDDDRQAAQAGPSTNVVCQNQNTARLARVDGKANDSSSA